MNESGLRAHNTSKRNVAGSLLLGAGLLLAQAATALPEDAQQPIEMDWNSGDFGLDDGLIILYGSDAEPAAIRQGSMLITGTEIRIERDADGINKVTTTGRPARFQQQLEPDQEPLRASGLTLIFDNLAQQLTLHEEVEVQHAGMRTQTYHFEYDLATRRFRSNRDPDGEQARLVVPPATPPAAADPQP